MSDRYGRTSSSCWPSCTSEPHVTWRRFRPKPRYVSVPSISSAAPIATNVKAATGTATIGTTSRAITRPWRAPSMRAAVTYSDPATTLVAVRATRANIGTVTSPRATAMIHTSRPT